MLEIRARILDISGFRICLLWAMARAERSRYYQHIPVIIWVVLSLQRALGSEWYSEHLFIRFKFTKIWTAPERTIMKEHLSPYPSHNRLHNSRQCSLPKRHALPRLRPSLARLPQYRSHDFQRTTVPLSACQAEYHLPHAPSSSRDDRIYCASVSSLDLL